jgi:hypothetical protein
MSIPLPRRRDPGVSALLAGTASAATSVASTGSGSTCSLPGAQSAVRAMSGPQLPPTPLPGRIGLFQAAAINMSQMVGIGPFVTIPLMVAAFGGPHAVIGFVAARCLPLPTGSSEPNSAPPCPAPAVPTSICAKRFSTAPVPDLPLGKGAARLNDGARDREGLKPAFVFQLTWRPPPRSSICPSILPRTARRWKYRTTTRTRCGTRGETRPRSWSTTLDWAAPAKWKTSERQSTALDCGSTVSGTGSSTWGDSHGIVRGRRRATSSPGSAVMATAARWRSLRPRSSMVLYRRPRSGP